MTNVALSHNLAVVFRHLEEVGNLHATFISVLTFANRDNAIGNFLLSHDEEVRHLLEFALANLVAEFLTPSAPTATSRSCQPASGRPRLSACTLSFTRAQKSVTSLVGLMGVPHTIVWVGLYCKATRAHLRLVRAALATKPCSQKPHERTARKPPPRGGNYP